MTTVLVLAAVSLVARWVYLWMEWSQDRTRRQMLRAVAKWKIEQRKTRSRTPGGSTNSDGGLPQTPPERTGVEPATTTRRAVAPPVPQTLVGTDCPRAPHAHPSVPARLQTSAGVGGPGTPVPAPAGLHRLGGAL